MNQLSNDAKVDRRTSRRVNKNASICWSYFDTNAHCKIHDAQMINFSESGMCFEADYFPSARPVICIRIKNGFSSTDTDDSKWLRSVRVGEVKWYKRIDRGDHSRFGIGVQYYR